MKPRVENAADLLLHKRPKNANVTVGKGEIFIKQQIQFALDSAVILPESTGLLTEIADALIKNPRIKRVEVQGHTDNTGTPDHNKTLSDERAPGRSPRGSPRTASRAIGSRRAATDRPSRWSRTSPPATARAQPPRAVHHRRPGPGIARREAQEVVCDTAYSRVCHGIAQDGPRQADHAGRSLGARDAGGAAASPLAHDA